MHGGAAPPPSRPPGAANTRMRRMSAPFHSSQRSLLVEMAAATGAAANDAPSPPATLAANKTKEKHPESSERDTASEKEPRRESSVLLFPAQSSKQDKNESLSVITALQQNAMALTACNQREKAMNEHLRKQVQALTMELKKTTELFEEEKTKNEKIAAMRKHIQKHGEYNGGYLPDIHSTAAAAAAAVALQQQAQLELTYQRKILTLENRHKDSMENNKRLLRKIEQLEKTEADTDSVIETLRLENVRLGTQVDTLTTTVASQSSLIVGLRTSLHKLNQEEHQIGTLMKKFDRSQIDLEATRVREKMLRDEHDRLKQIMGKEKESLMAKIMDFQQRLQQSDRAGDDMEALQDRTQRLEFEKRLVVEEMVTLREAVAKAETRMHEQEQMTNRLLLETEASQLDKKDLVARLSRALEELEAKKLLEAKLAVAQQREHDVANLMARVVELQGEMDASTQANTKLENELRALRQTQLSHDETVQALQLARQKAATHDALALVNEEKEALEARLKEIQEQFAQERADLMAKLRGKEEDHMRMQAQMDELPAQIASLKAQVQEPVTAALSTDDAEEQARVQGDILRLRSEYEDLQETFSTVENEYNKLVTKRYKTESFQNQVKLLHNENQALSARVEELQHDQERDRAELHARATEIVELQSRVMEPEALDLLRRTQESLEKTVSSLVEAEIASESTFTCLQCMRLFVSPLTLTPCGHTYCTSCVDTMGNVSIPSSIACKECSSAQREETETIFPNQALADLTARFIFRQQTLSSLTTMCLSLRNSFANRSST